MNVTWAFEEMRVIEFYLQWDFKTRFMADISIISLNYFLLPQEPSLFAVAKLLETGLVNLPRVEVLWKPVTAHVLEVSTFSLLGFNDRCH